MPRQPAAGAPDAASVGLRRLRGPVIVTALFALVALGFYDRASFACATGALLPSAVAWLLDVSPTMVLARTVIPLNVSTVIPFAVQIYFADEPGEKLSRSMVNPWIWLLIYAASIFGFLLYYFLPAFIRIYITLRTDKKRRDCLAAQKALREEWGNEVGQ